MKIYHLFLLIIQEDIYLFDLIKKYLFLKIKLFELN